MKKFVSIMIPFLLLCGTLVTFSSTGTCEETNGNTLYVGGSGDGNYSYIQDAINASSDGDTVFVYPGIYYESILINKSISLIGENKETTIIDGKEWLDVFPMITYVVTINAQWVNITSLTIQDGLVGICIESSTNIYQNNIDNNSIGIFLESNNSKIFNNTISNNTDVGIWIPELQSIAPSINNTFYHNNFINNSQHAYDECNSSWFYQNEGNYWDNYSGLDKNNDGIGDEPYKIPGGDNVDEYPLMMPYDGTIRLKEFYVDEGLLYTMLVIGMIVAILFCLPIAYIWYRKFHKVK